jgi:type VI protein secretion system component VasF
VPASAQQEKPPTGNNATDAQKQKIVSECADLLKMATDLKSEVDKTTKDTLSIAVVRKAGAIEQLAHKVRTGSSKD